MEVCDNHNRIERELGHLQGALDILGSLVRRTERVEARLSAVEKKIAKWAGIIVGLTSLPLLVKLYEILEPIAHAAMSR